MYVIYPQWQLEEGGLEEWMENVFVPERVQGFKALGLTGYKSVGQHKEKQNFNYTSS